MEQLILRRWPTLSSSLMAGNLTAQVRNIAEVTIAVANGDLSKKITVDVKGEILQLKEAINTMIDANKLDGIVDVIDEIFHRRAAGGGPLRVNFRQPSLIFGASLRRKPVEVVRIATTAACSGVSRRRRRLHRT